jgi:protein-S-isoprenylcysteine O-methyltransferase Ste14
MIRFPKPYADAVARLRVPSGFLVVAVFAWFSRPTPLSLEIALPVSLMGLALRAWAAGCLAKNRQLATGGPYAYTRNPLYLGTLLVAAGLSIAARSPGLGALFAAVFFLVYLPVIQEPIRISAALKPTQIPAAPHPKRKHSRYATGRPKAQ